MIAELDCVALTVALPEHGLAVGDVGTVVHAYKDGRGFTVEFTTYDGTTVALAKVAAAQIRPPARNEIHHARPFALAAHPSELEILPRLGHYARMSNVAQVEAELEKLSQAELRQVRDWLDNLIEDDLGFTPEFEAAIQQSERELAKGLRPRTRQS